MRANSHTLSLHGSFSGTGTHWANFLTEGATHLVLSAKPVWPHPACALHPWEASGRLPGHTERDHAPNQRTPRLSEHPGTAGRSSSVSL